MSLDEDDGGFKEAFLAWLDTDGEIPFDMYAQKPEKWAWLSDVIPGIIIYSAGGLLPFQAQGLLHGLPFYYRHEWGSASLAVAGPNGEPFGNEVLYRASVDYDEDVEIAGQSPFVDNLVRLVPSLERSPFLWEFPCRKLVFDKGKKLSYTVSDEVDIVVGWGHTPEEGFLATQKPSEYLLSHGWSVEFQRQMWVDRAVSSVPRNIDNRVFPEVAPDFHVNI